MPVGPLDNDAQLKTVRPVSSALFVDPHVNTAPLNRKGENNSKLRGSQTGPLLKIHETRPYMRKCSYFIHEGKV